MVQDISTSGDDGTITNQGRGNPPDNNLYIMNYREEIGSELQTLRVQKGLTVRELAEASGVHYSNIAKIENGRYNVSVDILGKVADALGYKVTFERR